MARLLVIPARVAFFSRFSDLLCILKNKILLKCKWSLIVYLWSEASALQKAIVHLQLKLWQTRTLTSN